MKILEPGHVYELDQLDGTGKDSIVNELGTTDILLYCGKHHEHHWAGTACRYCEEEDSQEPDPDEQGQKHD